MYRKDPAEQGISRYFLRIFDHYGIFPPPRQWIVFGFSQKHLLTVVDSCDTILTNRLSRRVRDRDTLL